MSLPETSDVEFEQTLRNEPAVLVDFWATWCQPCRQMKPIMSEIARDWKGQVVVVGANIDEVPHMVKFYAIQSIPTLIFIRNKREVHRIMGSQPKREIDKAIEKYLIR